MRHLLAATLVALIPLSACTAFKEAHKQPPPPPVTPVQLPAIPVGKNWEVIEQAPTLTNERHERTLPLQSEQSIQPPGPPPAAPTERRTVTTPR